MQLRPSLRRWFNGKHRFPGGLKVSAVAVKDADLAPTGQTSGGGGRRGTIVR